MPLHQKDGSKPRSIPPFTQEELDKAMKQLKKRRSPDTAGLIAEMLKDGGTVLQTILLTLYSLTKHVTK